jgi:hypothetical protein
MVLDYRHAMATHHFFRMVVTRNLLDEAARTLDEHAGVPGAIVIAAITSVHVNTGEVMSGGLENAL